MMSLKSIAFEMGVSKSLVHKYIKHGNLDALQFKKNLQVSKYLDKKSIKKDLDYELHLAFLGQKDKREVIDNVTRLVNYYEKDLKVKLTGYSYKSIIAKINGKRAIYSKTRSDKFSIRNEQLAKSFPKLRELAANIYFNNAYANLHSAVKLIKHYALTHEEYYELAAISEHTMYRQLKLDFKQSGFVDLHQYWNHYNLFKNALPTVPGAFTDDINYKDYYIIDDHKSDVFKVKVYDEKQRKVVEKQVFIWTCLEAKTMDILSIRIKFDSFTSDDLIELVAEAILIHGLPNKAISADNGLGRSDEFQNFINRINTGLDDQIYISYSRTRTPTNKAPVERSFGLIKMELDAFHKNFVSPNKEKDSRHETDCLTPPEADRFFEDYKKELLNYIDTWYKDKPRTRTINGKKEKITIRQYAEREAVNHQMRVVTPRQMRYAISREKIVTLKYREITFMGQSYLTMENIPLNYNNAQVRVLYYPGNLNEVDIYAVDDMLDRTTGTLINKGEYICTMYNTRVHPEKYQVVAKTRKAITKNVREIAKNIMHLSDLDERAYPGLLPITMTPNGELIEERKIAAKAVENTLNEKIESLPEMVISQQPLSYNKTENLEYEDVEEINKINKQLKELDNG